MRQDRRFSRCNSYQPSIHVLRRALALTVLLATTLLAVGSSPGTAAPPGFVGRSGTNLELDGQPYRFSGINIYNANNLSGCWYAMGSGSTLDESLSAISSTGGPKVMRAWFFQALATAGGARDWSAIDNTLAVAAAHGTRVIATLGNQWSDCDGPGGGAGSYKDHAWYTGGYTEPDPAGTRSYRDWAAEIVDRYKNDPTILAWQLLNEAEVKPSEGSSCSPDAAVTLKDFADDVSGLIKSIDANHLVSLGTMGGGQCGAQGAEYQDVHDLATIDLCEYHDYGSPSTPMPGDQWNGLQVRVDQCNALDKPLFVGETGIRQEDLPTLQSRANAFWAKFEAQFFAGIDGILVWAWNKDGSVGSYDIGPSDPVLPLLDAYRHGDPGGVDPLGQVTEYSDGMTAGSSPRGIAAGPDGNMWFAEIGGNRIGKITPSGVVTEYSAGISPGSQPYGIAAGPDGNMWFTEINGDRIGKITPSGVVTEYSAGISPGSRPYGVAAGPDGNMWFTEISGNRIGKITPSGVVTEYSAGISSGSGPSGIAAGPDGNMWFAEQFGDRIGKITPSGTVTEFSAGITSGSTPVFIAAGADDNMWFTESGASRIGRITPSGTVTEFSAGISAGSYLVGIAGGPDGNMWFTHGDDGPWIGRITPAGTVTQFSAGISAGSGLFGIAAGPDGNMWFSESSSDRIGKIGVGSIAPPDSDGDSVPDSQDNCPSIANAGQANADGDSLGDACDPDPAISETLQPDGTPEGSFANTVQGKTNPTTGTLESGTATIVDALCPASNPPTDPCPAGAVDPTKGVRVTAITDTVLSVCPFPTALEIEIPAGFAVTITCGSVIVEDVTGAPGTSVKVKVSGVIVSFPPGTAGTVDTVGGISVTGVTGTGVTLTIGGATAPVPPGNSNVIRGGSGNSTITGTAGNDVIVDTGGNNTIDGKGGNDSITTVSGNDTIDGGDGNDVINAGDGNNTVRGGKGDDVIITGSGNDMIDGGAGTDTCTPGGPPGKNSVKNCSP